MNVRKQSIVKVENHLRVKGNWQEMKTLDKSLVLDRYGMELIARGDSSDYKTKEGFVLSPSVVPITHAYYCLTTSDPTLKEILELNDSEVVDNPTSVDTAGHVWVKVKDAYRVRELSDWHDWTKLNRYHDLKQFKELPKRTYRFMFYDYEMLFKEYADTPQVRGVLEVFGQTDFNMNEVDLYWYRYTCDGRIAIDEACNKYVFSRITSKGPLLHGVPLMTIVPAKKSPKENHTKELISC